MYPAQILAVASVLLAGVNAWEPPQYNGFTRVWQATFIGAADTLPNSKNWNIITGDKNDNNELQRYTNNKQNVRFSGSGTLQILPRKDSSAPKGWTSGRIESKYTVTPAPGKITRMEASLRVAGNPTQNKKGMWYAFWMNGDAFRKGVPWPQCGEIDMFENINGEKKSYGVLHCDKYPAGICNEPYGLVTNTPLNDNQQHVYRVEIDRKNSDFRKQTMTWFKDGAAFHKVTGEQINNEKVWGTLAHSAYYFILNVAVGGNWVSLYPLYRCMNDC